MVESLNQDFGQKTIKGIPWNELKFKLSDPAFDAESFRVSVSKTLFFICIEISYDGRILATFIP